MVRLGYHRSLTGGVASRPNLPQKELAMQLLSAYSALPGHPYPLNVRVPFVPDLMHSQIHLDLPTDKPFLERHNLYQRVRKCIRNKQNLDTLAFDP